MHEGLGVDARDQIILTHFGEDFPVVSRCTYKKIYVKYYQIAKYITRH